MNEFNLRRIGWLALLAGMLGVLAVGSLILFFLGLSQNIASLSPMGGVNDTLNAGAGITSALLASVLHPALCRQIARLSSLVLIGAWAGAIAVIFGAWLIQTGRADVELSSYYFFYGNGLIGIWLLVLNLIARKQAVWTRGLTLLGIVAGGFMMIGLPGLYGIVLGLDGADFSSLLLLTGISFLGTGILYPVWAIWLGRWILAGRTDKIVAEVPH